MPKVQRMETGADWSHTFFFKGGQPPVPIPIAGWTLEGKASISELEATTVDLTGSKLQVVNHVVQEADLASDETLVVGQEIQALRITLTGQDTSLLGANMITIEVRRLDPPPMRPILRVTIPNHEGF